MISENFKTRFFQFCERINFAKSSLSNEDIKFMNGFNKTIDKIAYLAGKGKFQSAVYVLMVHNTIIAIKSTLNDPVSNFHNYFSFYFNPMRLIEKKEIKLPSKSSIYDGVNKYGVHQFPVLYDGQKFTATIHKLENVQL